MAMSRKHYEKIAGKVKEFKPYFQCNDSMYTGEDAYLDFVHELCVIFEEDNDRFSPDRFKKATGELYEEFWRCNNQN